MNRATKKVVRLMSMAMLAALLLLGVEATRAPEASAGTWVCSWRVVCVYQLSWNETNALANWSPDHDSNTDVAILLGPFEALRVHAPIMWAYRFSARKSVAAGNCVAISVTGMMVPARCRS